MTDKRERDILRASAAARMGVDADTEVTFERHPQAAWCAIDIRLASSDRYIGSHLTIAHGELERVLRMTDREFLYWLLGHLADQKPEDYATKASLTKAINDHLANAAPPAKPRPPWGPTTPGSR